jgi:hypothetical protein
MMRTGASTISTTTEMGQDGEGLATITAPARMHLSPKEMQGEAIRRAWNWVPTAMGALYKVSWAAELDAVSRRLRGREWACLTHY